MQRRKIDVKSKGEKRRRGDGEMSSKGWEREREIYIVIGLGSCPKIRREHLVLFHPKRNSAWEFWLCCEAATSKPSKQAPQGSPSGFSLTGPAVPIVSCKGPKQLGAINATTGQ